MSKQRDNLLLSRFDLTRVANLHVDVTQIVAANHALHRTRIRHDHDVVLVDTLGAQSLRRQHTGDGERYLFDSQNLANRIFIAVNLCRGCTANDTNLIRAAHVLRRE